MVTGSGNLLRTLKARQDDPARHIQRPEGYGLDDRTFTAAPVWRRSETKGPSADLSRTAPAAVGSDEYQKERNEWFHVPNLGLAA